MASAASLSLDESSLTRKTELSGALGRERRSWAAGHGVSDRSNEKVSLEFKCKVPFALGSRTPAKTRVLGRSRSAETRPRPMPRVVPEMR